MSTCVIVAGTYRSGTSLLARFLHESGVNMNPAPVNQDLAGWHPTGSYKDAILEGMTFRGWPDYYAKRQTGQVWGVKSHALLFSPKLLEGFLAACPAERRVLIWTTRNADDSAQSWQSLRRNIPLEACRNIIGEQIMRLSAIFADWPEADRLAVQFPDTAIDPQGQLEGVANLIGVPFSAEACAHIRADIPRWS
jgi:hypothetical protein